MNVADRLRVERTVLSYDWWLDLRGANGRRRRELRRELRANLVDATQHVGSGAAVRSLGSTREMAAEALPPDRTRPRWAAGLQAGLAALTATLLLELLAALTWLDGAEAADPDGRVTGPLTLFPGSSVEYTPVESGFSFFFAPGWTALAVGLLVLVVVARPWRLARRSPRPRSRTQAGSSQAEPSEAARSLRS
jgi:hypothetical protein